MFRQIEGLLKVLEQAGISDREDVTKALTDFAAALPDADYRSYMQGEIALVLARSRHFERAEETARLIDNCQKSEYLRRIGETEVRNGAAGRALSVLKEAHQAAFLHRFPTQQSQDIAEVAQALEALDQKTAIATWKAAVQIASDAQSSPGTDGPEASSVLLDSVKAFARLGQKDEAKATAALIKVASIRETAFSLCK